MELTWLGRSCFEIVTRDGTRVLFDPFLEWCPQPPVTPDVICVSHGHLDHFADVPDLVRGDSPAQVVAIGGGDPAPVPRSARTLARNSTSSLPHRLGRAGRTQLALLIRLSLAADAHFAL
jgi:glyoxylase-like metal-dependent hydrolase (beta-lactamase superfamily II)